jgi:hypothetical protein
MSGFGSRRARQDAARQTGWIKAALIGGVPSWVLFYWLVSYGTWNPARSEFSSDFYDAQARGFLHGTFAMPAKVLLIEAFHSHGRDFMYYGPTLAILRLPFAAFWPATSGRLSGPSLMVADAVILAAAAALFLRVRAVILTSTDPPRPFEYVTMTFFMAAVGTGSVVIFLASSASVYQETELWAMAWVVLGLYVALGVLVRPSRAGALALGFVALAATETRVSVGLGVLGLVGMLAVAHGVTWEARRHGRPAPRWLRKVGLDVPVAQPVLPVLLGAGVLASVVTASLVSWAKFRTFWPLSLNYLHQVLTTSALAPASYVSFVHQYPTLTSLSFLPNTLWWYFRPNGLVPSALFPFVNFPMTVNDAHQRMIEKVLPTASVTATAPLLLVLCTIGLGWPIFSRLSGRSSGLRRVRRLLPLLASCALGCVGVLTYGVVAFRYTGDLTPLIVLGAIVGLVELTVWHGRLGAGTTRHGRVGMVVALTVLLLWSTWSNTGLAYLTSRANSPAVPASARAASIRTGLWVASILHERPPPDVYHGRVPPETSAMGSLFVQGTCRALFEQTSESASSSSGWVGVEWSRAAGHVRLVLQRPTGPVDRPMPLVVGGRHAGALDVAALELRPDDRFQVLFLSEGWSRALFGNTWISGPSRPWPSSGQLNLDVVIDAWGDPSLRSVQIFSGDDSLLNVAVAIHPVRRETIGRLPINPADDPSLAALVAARYQGAWRTKAVTTPLCHQTTSHLAQ